jgi:hypothetical protein
LPALVLISILLWHHLSQQASPRVQRTVASGYLILGLVAVLINSYQGLYNTNTQRWNGYMLAPNIDRYPTYLLDWRYPQFLATGDTLCARNLEHMLQGLRSGAFDLDRLQFGESITYASGFAQIPPATSGPRPATDTASMEETAAASHHQHRTLLPVVLFSRENAAFVGWSKASTTYRWSECHEASIMFELDDLAATTGRYELLISSGAYGVQRAIVFLNGSHIGSVVVPSFGATKAEHRIPFDGSLLKADDLNEIRFVLPDAHPPAGRDARLLGLAFVGLQIEATGLDVP